MNVQFAMFNFNFTIPIPKLAMKPVSDMIQNAVSGSMNYLNNMKESVLVLLGEDVSHYLNFVTKKGRLTNEFYAMTLVTALFFTLLTLAILYHYTHSYILAQDCKVSFDWVEPRKVGDTVGFKLGFYRLDGTPHKEANSQTLVRNTRVLVNHKNDEDVSVLQSVEGNAIHGQFVVAAPGTYNLSLKFNGFSVAGTPIKKTFLPGMVYPPMTTVLRPDQSCVLLTDWLSSRILVVPQDPNGFPCGHENVDINKFRFTASTNEQNSNLSSEDINSKFIWSFDIIGNVDSEISGKDKSEASCCIYLNLKAKTPGVYQGKILYDDTLLKNGFFSIIVLTIDERRVVTEVSENADNNDSDGHISNVPAILNSLGEQPCDCPLEVTLDLSPTCLTINEAKWTVLKSKVVSFKMSARLFIYVLNVKSSTDTYVFTVTDGVEQNAVLEMASAPARIVMAIFAHFYVQSTGRFICFTDKEKFFYEGIRSLCNGSRFTKRVILIDPENVVDSTFTTTEHFGSSDWRSDFVVSYIGDKVIEDRVALEEWLEDLCYTYFVHDDYYASKDKLFYPLDGNISGLVHPNKDRNRHPGWTLDDFTLAGKVVGKCLLEAAFDPDFRNMIPARFTRSFLSQLLGRRPSYKQFQVDDPNFYLGTVSKVLHENVSGMGLTFTEPYYTMNGQFFRHVDLIPNGSHIGVTNENKEDYLNALANYHLAFVFKEEVEAFRDGLMAIIPADLISIFDENELELIMCGASKFNVMTEMKPNVDATISENRLHTSRLLEWFWYAVENMNETDRGRLLQFVTGTSILPSGGFHSLQPRFKITFSTAFDVLPSAKRDLHHIILTEQKNKNEFEKALLKAISAPFPDTMNEYD